MVQVAGKLNMVNPDIASLLDSKGISSSSQHFRDNDISNDDIALSEHAEANTREL